MKTYDEPEHEYAMTYVDAEGKTGQRTGTYDQLVETTRAMQESGVRASLVPVGLYALRWRDAAGHEHLDHGLCDELRPRALELRAANNLVSLVPVLDDHPMRETI